MRADASDRAESAIRGAALRGVDTVSRMGTDSAASRPVAPGARSDEGRDDVPERIEISEERRQELLEEAGRYVAEMKAKLGEPSAEAMRRAERLWNDVYGPVSSDATE